MKPRAAIGVGLFLLYVTILIVLGQVGGVDYDAAWDSTHNVLTGILPALVVGGGLIGFIAWRIGWWSWAIRDRHRVRAWWMLVPAALALVAVIANFAATDWGEVTLDFFLATLVLGVAVGFAEEFVCRGVLLVGLRGTFQEVGAWALSCLLFGLMHIVNIFLGAPVGGTVGQIISAAMAGSTFYLLRRYYGLLIPAMVLHGLGDMSIFVQEFSKADGTILSLLEWPGGVIALVAGFVVARRTQNGEHEPYAVEHAPPAVAEPAAAA